MRLNLNSIVRVQSRIEEIERRVRPKRDDTPPEKKPERFVDLLAREEAAQLAPAKGAVEERTTRTTAAAGKDWEAHIPRVAEQYGVEEALIRAVIRMESGGRTEAVSHKGAMGIMQLMPATARMLGVDDPFDPVQNLEGGVKYLSQLSDKYNGDLVKTLAAYNAGPGRVDSYGGVPPFPETQKYVRSVLAMYERNLGGER